MHNGTGTSGFGSMDQTLQREIARKGGMAAHRKGTAHEFTADEARDAGRKGGRQVSANRAHMMEIGRLGGKRSAERRRLKTGSPVVRREVTPGEAPTDQVTSKESSPETSSE